MSGPTRMSSAPTRTPARCRCGWISRLVVTARSSETPGACGSTRASRTPPSPRAGTTIRAARCAWGTASSVPSSTHPSSPPVALTAGVPVGLPAVPFRAAVRKTSPETTPGSQRARCAAEPKCARGNAPRTSVAHSGTGATARPCASSRRHSSMSPWPAPPSDSGTAIPRRSASPSAFHTPRSTRSSLFSTVPTRSGSTSPANTPAAASETASCSSLRWKSIRRAPPRPARRRARRAAATARRRGPRTRPAAPSRS